MKNKILKIFAIIFCFAALMTGCATVSDVKINGKNANFSSLQYNQGQIIKVGNYVYFGNGYTDSSNSDFNYDKAKKAGYLARMDMSKPLSYDSKVTDDRKNNTSPKGNEKVSDNRLIGYQNQNMYALGEYIYFTSANTHKSSSLENDYTKVSLFRIKFNGDDLKELISNTSFKVGDGGSITIQKGSNNHYYYVIIEPTDDSSFTIKTISIGENIGELKTIVKDAKSYCLPDDQSTSKEIFYTVDSEQSHTTTAVKSVDIASGNITEVDNGMAGSTTKMLGRTGDIVFYSYKNPENKVEEVYYKDIASSDSYFTPSSSQRFYNATTISNIKKAGEGYIFTTSGGSLMYKTLNSGSQLLLTSDGFSDILFVENDYVYTSNTKTIKRISTINQTEEEIVSLSETELISGQCGYDGEYIYYYSQIDTSGFEDVDEDAEKDSNYYLFRTDKLGLSQMIGKSL